MADGSAQTRGAFWAATIRDKLGYSWAYFAIPGPEFVHKSSLVSLLLLSAEGSCKGQVQRAGAKGSALKGAGSILGLVSHTIVHADFSLAN